MTILKKFLQLNKKKITIEILLFKIKSHTYLMLFHTLTATNAAVTYVVHEADRKKKKKTTAVL